MINYQNSRQTIIEWLVEWKLILINIVKVHLSILFFLIVNTLHYVICIHHMH